MLGAAAVNAIKSISFSDTTMARRIEEMACDVSLQVIEKIKQVKCFALQLDESTDISNQAQLLMYVRYYDEGINDQILACKSLLGKTTGEKIFEVLDGHIRAECEFKWEWCTSISSDGAASITGHTNGLIARLKSVNLNLKWQHCMIHKQALATKKMSPELHMVLDDAVKIVNYIKSRALNSRLFKIMCEEMGANHTQLLLHTEVRWLSRGRVLTRLFEMRHEVCTFLSDMKSD
ncbi:SCAN domain-containing protein 3-like [Oopsacas minuta]|uniref:SCAN domain-containing protein 3-like n=1 Tax=Oopsacas minuta TaxID=111878 RepID=A0AAV7JSR9_9METZ|nr:SCAN domain-containing protein 3-like [Oopsacas minuta]